jgi:hypothetical protein
MDAAPEHQGSNPIFSESQSGKMRFALKRGLYYF